MFLLDRYFLSVPVLKRLKELNSSGSVRMDLVTKAKQSCAARKELLYSCCAEKRTSYAQMPHFLFAYVKVKA